MQDLESKVQQLLKIYSIPLREEWEGCKDSTTYSVYRYWRVLNLLSQEDLEKVMKERSIGSNTNFINFFKMMDYHFDSKIYKNGLVADIGSGFGFITFWLILSGAKKVYSIGDPERIQFIEKLYKRAVAEGLVLDKKLVLKPEFVKVGDETLSDKIAGGSLDLILLNDTLEHITPRIFPFLVKAASNNLKKGGYFISRQQNTDSPKMFQRLSKMWDESERTTYINQRLELIQAKVTDIDEKAALELAKKTRGLDSVDFYAAIDNYLKDGTFPSHDLNIPSIDVIIDVPYEGNTSIERICGAFKKYNFQKVSVYPDLLSSRRSKLFQPLAKLLPSFFLKFQIWDQTTVFVMRK